MRRPSGAADVPAVLRDEGLELAFGGLKRIPDRDVRILVGTVLVMGAVDDDLGTVREHKVDPKLIPLALVFVLVRRIEYHTATGDPVVELFKLGHTFPNLGFEGR
jgi:hypothetical protein